MEKEIIWTEKALQDRFEIYTFWAYHNQSHAFSEKLDQKIQDSVKLIAKHPTIGKKSDFHGIRMKVMVHVSIFYMVSDKDITIIRIWDNRQNPKKLFFY